jgi:hypothetical protein
MACNRQLDLGLVAVDRDGLLDDPKYIEEAGGAVDPGRENVAALSVSVVASLLSQFVSLAVGPGGFGEPGPLRYLLSTHTLEHLPSMPSNPNCYYESALAVGDQRLDLTGPHPQADRVRSDRAGRAKKMRLVRWIHRTLDAGLVGLDSYVGRSPARH